MERGRICHDDALHQLGVRRDGGNHADRAVSAEGVLALPQLDQRNAERPDVGLETRLVIKNLRSHVEERPAHSGTDGQGGIELVGEAEVPDLDHSLL